MKFPRFDVHDQALIEGAFTTGEPAHIAKAIRVGTEAFLNRLLAMPNGLPIVDGRPHLVIKKPANFFDEYVITLVLQQLADEAGQVVSVYRVGEEQKTDHSLIPEIQFN